jgi:molybdopterin converting factor small subunit
MTISKRISVEVVLFANLREYHPVSRNSGPFQQELPEGTTVDGLMETLGITGLQTRLHFVDGLNRDGGYVLKDGERVALFSPIAGG